MLNCMPPLKVMHITLGIAIFKMIESTVGVIKMKTFYHHWSTTFGHYNRETSTMGNNIIGAKWVLTAYITTRHTLLLMLYLVAPRIIDVDKKSLLKSSVS